MHMWSCEGESKVVRCPLVNRSRWVVGCCPDALQLARDCLVAAQVRPALILLWPWKKDPALKVGVSVLVHREFWWLLKWEIVPSDKLRPKWYGGDSWVHVFQRFLTGLAFSTEVLITQSLTFLHWRGKNRIKLMADLSIFLRRGPWLTQTVSTAVSLTEHFRPKRPVSH